MIWRKILDDIRGIVGIWILTKGIQILPSPDREECAATVKPLAKIWTERSRRALIARGIKVPGEGA